LGDLYEDQAGTETGEKVSDAKKGKGKPRPKSEPDPNRTGKVAPDLGVETGE